MYSRKQVNRAGEALRSSGPDLGDYEQALEVLSNWRSCHGYPVNTFQATLRDRIKPIDKHAIVAQRLKRAPSIIAKLKRFERMQLARMQDIGGLRAVVGSVRALRRIRERYQEGTLSHELANVFDYTAQPKPSGYRSVHLIYRYRNKLAPSYDGLFVELQLRTRQQHAWATAVETMGTFLNQALKSSEGPEEWLQFFALAGCAFSFEEGGQAVPGYEKMSVRAVCRQLREDARRLRVDERLRAFAVAANAISGSSQGAYHLILLDASAKTVTIRSFPKARLEEANESYTRLEARLDPESTQQAVLVSTSSVKSLRRAYPNYFLDTADFLKILDRITRAASRRPAGIRTD